MGIKSGLKGGPRKYTDEQIEYVKNNVANTEKKLTEMFNKKFKTNYSVVSISHLKVRLGIHSGLNSGRFEKGHKPFNKGKKWSDYLSDDSQKNMMKTTFKKGNLPYNHRPVGSERISKDGYLEIKIAEPNEWRMKHRLVYEQIKGEIPKGYIVTFADGNKLNLDLDNLILAKRTESLIMNNMSLYSDNADCTKSGLLVAKIVDKINNIKKLERNNASKY